MSKKTHPFYIAIGAITVLGLLGLGGYWCYDFLAGSCTIVVHNNSSKTITNFSLLWTDDKTSTKISRFDIGETFRFKHRPKRDGHAELTFSVENETMTMPFGYMTTGLRSTGEINIDDKMVEELLTKGSGTPHPNPLPEGEGNAK